MLAHTSRASCTLGYHYLIAELPTQYVGGIPTSSTLSPTVVLLETISLSLLSTEYLHLNQLFIPLPNMALRIISTALLVTKLAMASPRPQVDMPGVSLVDRQSGTCKTCIVCKSTHLLSIECHWKQFWAAGKLLALCGAAQLPPETWPQRRTLLTRSFMVARRQPLRQTCQRAYFGRPDNR